MTEAPTTGDGVDPVDGTGARATIRTTHGHPRLVAAAIAPDNTQEIDTRAAEGTVVTTVTREDASGLASTVDDYLVNLDVAARIVDRTTDHATVRPNDTESTTTNATNDRHDT